MKNLNLDTLRGKVDWVRKNDPQITNIPVGDILVLDVDEAQYLIDIITEIREILDVVKLKGMLNEDI